MAKYKAKKTYKSAKDKYFNIGTVNLLIRGGTVQLDENSFSSLPKNVKQHLELLNKPNKVSKPDTKKKKQGDK